MSLQLAIEDLGRTLSASSYLDRVDDLPLNTGAGNMSLVIGVGGQTTSEQYGRSRYIQALDLTLTVKTKITAAQLAGILREIDNEIITDRRRGGQAQTTVLDEEGWTPEESENKNATVITRNVEVHVYEDSV